MTDRGNAIATLTGVVAHWTKGSTFGFIRPDDPNISDVFVHFKDVEPWRKGFKELTTGQVVKFDLADNEKTGGQKAVNVEVARNTQLNEHKFKR